MISFMIYKGESYLLLFQEYIFVEVRNLLLNDIEEL